MSSRVIINGAFGKMGVLTCQTLNNHPDFEIVASLGREDNLASTLHNTQADLVIDLTRADCVYKNTCTIIHAGMRPVIGTSGLSAEQVQDLQQQCAKKNLGGIIVPNFSLSAVLMMRFAAEAARLLPDVEIIEGHHPQKWDAPSGTAIKTAEMIAKAQPYKSKISSENAISGARGALIHGIPIHAVRLPGILAQQQVIFGHTGETLTISHQSLDRQAYMPGIILACQKVLTFDKLYYGLEEILN